MRMPVFSSTHARQNALIILSLCHLAVIVASNILVQIPIEIGFFHSTWGAFTFPFLFLFTDLTVRLFGQQLARRIIFVVMFPALLLSYVLSATFVDGKYVGLVGLASLNVFVLRIAIASFVAYVCGQLIDITVFNRLRRLKTWWIAPAASTVFGNLADSLIFFSVAFYQSPDAYMAEHWLSIGAWDYTYKILIGLLFFVPAYGALLSAIVKRFTQDAPLHTAQHSVEENA